MHAHQNTDTFAHEFTHTLTQIERYILMLHYCEDLTAYEIGLVLNLSEETIEASLIDLRERTRLALAERTSAVA